MKKNCHDCCYPHTTDPESCGCCEGIEIVTPLSIYNRPGLAEISYRIGTHGSFLETMMARLAGCSLEKQDTFGNTIHKSYPLKGLTTRNNDDPSLAFLDAWATVADVLTFYQERIANEGYLRTATERRSVLELAKLVGYKLRPGVSSSVFLAYTLDENHKEETVIPAGSRVQSIPGPDELPQAFETGEDLKARAQWNNLKPRMTKPQTMGSIEASKKLYLKGLNTNLKPNEPLLIGVGNNEPKLFWIKDIQPDVDNDRTLIKLEPAEPVQEPATAIESETVVVQGVSMPNFNLPQLISALTLLPSITPASSLKLDRKIAEIFGTKDSNRVGEASHGVIKALAPQLRNTFAVSLANANVTTEDKIKVYALRVKAAPFAHNAPLRPVRMNDQNVMQYSEWDIKNPHGVGAPTASFNYSIGEDNHTVTFENISISVGQINSISWDFGDGESSGDWEPVHHYERAGNYSVKLTITGPGGIGDLTIVITIDPPVG